MSKQQIFLLQSLQRIGVKSPMIFLINDTRYTLGLKRVQKYKTEMDTRFRRQRMINTSIIRFFKFMQTFYSKVLFGFKDLMILTLQVTCYKAPPLYMFLNYFFTLF